MTVTELTAGSREVNVQDSSLPSGGSQTLQVECLSTEAVSSVKGELCIWAYKYPFTKVLMKYLKTTSPVVLDTQISSLLAYCDEFCCH